MDANSLSTKSKKRTVDAILTTTETSDSASHKDIVVPRILRRYYHRRRNVAATIWGPDVVSASKSSTTTHFVAPKQSFNIYKALLRHPNLFFQFALRLPYPAIINLYAIDKEFHYRLNKYSVSLIHDYAKYHAPLAGFVFSWVLYPELCISDPMLRPMDKREWLARDVPGFRWVGMVLWRERVVRSILTQLALEGHKVPEGTMGALMKFWVVMEMNTTKMRQAFLQDSDIWTDADIFLFHLFHVKLDMRFANPILGNGACGLSHMLLTQSSLSALWKILTDKLKLDYDKTTDMLVRTYLTEDLDTDTHPWLDDELDNGIPEEEWGILCRERWHMDGTRMDSAADMVISEGIRRQLGVQQYYMDFTVYGFEDEKVGKNMPAPRMWRTDRGVVLHSGGWLGKRHRERILKALDERGGIHGIKEEDVMDTGP